jgi:hypothetical protein
MVLDAFAMGESGLWSGAVRIAVIEEIQRLPDSPIDLFIASGLNARHCGEGPDTVHPRTVQFVGENHI